MIKIKISDFLGKHKMSQKDLAIATGIRPSTINSYYHETIKEINKEHLNKFCKVFHCQPGDLLEYIPEDQS